MVSARPKAEGDLMATNILYPILTSNLDCIYIPRISNWTVNRHQFFSYLKANFWFPTLDPQASSVHSNFFLLVAEIKPLDQTFLYLLQAPYLKFCLTIYTKLLYLSPGVEQQSSNWSFSFLTCPSRLCSPCHSQNGPPDVRGPWHSSAWCSSMIPIPV